MTNGKGVAVDILKINADGSMKLTAETDIGGAHSTLKAQGFELGWTHQGKDTVDGSMRRSSAPRASGGTPAGATTS